MSLRYEQQRSLHTTRKFMVELATRPWSSWTAREVKDMARRCLRHYPPLDRTGAPMFSRDDFPCPELDAG